MKYESSYGELELHRRRRSSKEPPGIEIQMLKSKNEDEAVGRKRCIQGVRSHKLQPCRSKDQGHL